MSGNTLSEIRKMADEVTSREGCFVYDLELVGAGGGRTLRVTIDKEAEGGASIQDCSNVSRGLNLMLEVDEEVVPGGQYLLEVSSPGLERVLKVPRHFERAIGQTISVNSFAPLLDFNPQVPELGKAKRIQGELGAFDDKGIKLAIELGKDAEGEPASKEIFIPFEMVTKAHVVFQFEDSAQPKPGKSSKKGKHKK
ncbi:MAG: ribosome maturation factor RimP [Bdellovibrionota bacterium]